MGVLLCKMGISQRPASRVRRSARDAVRVHSTATSISFSGPGSAESPGVGLLTLAPAKPKQQEEDRKEGAL